MGNMGVACFLDPKSTYYLLLFFFISSLLWIIKSPGIYNKAWSLTPGGFVLVNVSRSPSHQSMFIKKFPRSHSFDSFIAV